MRLKNIEQANLGGKRVLIRVDFNVGFSGGKLSEAHRITAVKKTVDYVLSKKNVKVALLAHLGRPHGVDPKFSFSLIYKQIGEVLDKELVFVEDCVGEVVKKGLDNLSDGQILMLENVRFHEQEYDNDKEFAQNLAKNFDVYINEAFGASHRDDASVDSVVGILPSWAGFNLNKEVTELDKIREGFLRPAVAIVGGAKIETKLPMINFFAENYDTVLVGGKLGKEAQGRGINFPVNVILPTDYLGEGLDIGPETIKEFVGRIEGAKTIVWNGPLGKFEDSQYSEGTFEILDSIVNNKLADKVAGGGETAQVLEEKGSIKEFDFVSTGGGAMLEYIAKGTLPALEALQVK